MTEGLFTWISPSTIRTWQPFTIWPTEAALSGRPQTAVVILGEHSDVYKRQGSLLGYVAEPTKYYSVEGSNVYFEMTHEGTPVDPLDYLE